MALTEQGTWVFYWASLDLTSLIKSHRPHCVSAMDIPSSLEP